MAGRNILVIKLGALGDALIATSAVRQILAHHGGDEVWLLSSPACDHVFEGWPGLRVTSFARRGASAFLRTLAWIRRQGFQRVYDLQSSDRSGILVALSGIPERVGNHPRFPYNIHPDDPPGRRHACDRLLEMLRRAGIPAREEPPGLPALAGAEQNVAQWIGARGLDGAALCLLHAGGSAGHPEKRWPYFRELAVVLRERGVTPVWIGGPGDAALNRELAGHAGVDATALCSPLQQLVALGARASFAVANDSAPMHALACTALPVYGIFGHTDWRRHHAVGKAAFVIAMDIDEPAFRRAPLADLGLETVVRRLEADGRI